MWIVLSRILERSGFGIIEHGLHVGWGGVGVEYRRNGNCCSLCDQEVEVQAVETTSCKVAYNRYLVKQELSVLVFIVRANII